MMSSPVDGSLYAVAVRQVDAAADILGLPDGVRRILCSPKRVFTFQVPIERETGEIEVLSGCRVHHNINRGPALGGLRYHLDSSVEEAIALAMQMTWKCGVMQLPFGGAAGALICDPAGMSLRELERLTRRYTNELAPLIGPTNDIIMPGLNTDSQVMAWIMDTYSMHQGYTVPAVVAGKDVSIGGTEGRLEAIGLGVVTALARGASTLGKKLAGCRVAVQGFGNVGRTVASLLSACECKIVAVGEAAGGALLPLGLDVGGLIDHCRTGGQLQDLPGAESISYADMPSSDCDILVLAAGDSCLTLEDAPSIRARLVVEAIAGTTSEEAYRLLDDRGVLIVPEVLAGAGNAVVSYFEWVQGRQESFWTPQQVHERLDAAMSDAFAQVWAARERFGVSFRSAAYALAVKAVADATEYRGIYP